MKRALLIFPWLFAAVGACDPVPTYCNAMADCDNFEAQFPLGLDQVGQDNDSVNVCVADNQGLLRQLRANEEKICAQQADHYQIYMACAADAYSKDPSDDCNVLEFGNNNPCHDELSDFLNDLQDAGDNCSPSET